jgi:hypothetical protein
MHTTNLRRSATVLFAMVTLVLLGVPVRAAVTLPGGTKVEKVDFEKHVMGLFGRMGCNSGSCHGSFQGKGGFRLSLFGYDPEMDYDTLLHDAFGRRLNFSNPDKSLLLLKPTGQLPHGGKTRFGRHSWQYDLLRTWIAQGAKRKPGSGTIEEMTITPDEVSFSKAGEETQLAVTVRFGDGSTQNITALCDFRTNDDAVASVDPDGKLVAEQPGDTAIIVSYRGKVVPVRVLVPMTLPPGFRYPKVPEVNYIDREVFAKLRRMNMVPSDLASDEVFLRRLYLDTIGNLPSPDEIRAFLKNKDPNKRSKKIDELLAHPLHAALWATKFCDITGNNTDELENPRTLQPKMSQMWHDWFRKRIQDNMPYDQIVHGVLCATTREGKSPDKYLADFKKLEQAAVKGWKTGYEKRETLDWFWRSRQRVPIEQLGEKTAVAFLGVRLECAQCHKHPFDRWTQADYRSYANVFTQVGVGTSSEAKKLFDRENKARRKNRKKRNSQLTLREVYVVTSGRGVSRPLNDPKTNKPLAPKTLGGPELTAKNGEDLREKLFAWMRSPDNPFFARSFVNRVWGHYFGRGIVDPVDDFSLANPPSNNKLLDALAKDFVASGYDIRKLERTVLNSRTYQLSSTPNDTNRLDKNNYSHSYVRPLLAEVVVDALNTSLGTEENFGRDAPPDCKAIEIGPSRVQSNTVAQMFRVFGRSTRTMGCDCERPSEATIAQKLFLMADPTLQGKLQGNRNRVKSLLASKMSDDKIVEELFLATVSRFPGEKEKSAAVDHLSESQDKQKACSDLLWALLNTDEFIFNH